MIRTPSLRRFTPALFFVLLLVAPTSGSAGDETLTLHVNDAEGAPGGVVAVVVAAYESKGIGQGQACFRANAPLFTEGDGGPFAGYIGSAVFSTEDDAQHQLQAVPGSGQRFLMEFFSPTGTINETEGVISVIYLRLRDDLVPGQRFMLGLDIQDTFLIDDAGAPIPVEVRGGELLVRAPGSPVSVEADAGRVRPGGFAQVNFETAQPVGFSSGEVLLEYDEAIASGDPVVVIAPRFGGATFDVDTSVPGQVLVSFVSEGATLNRIPGGVIHFYIPTRSDVPLGTRSPVGFDPIATRILDKDGQPIAFAFESDVIEFTLD